MSSVPRYTPHYTVEDYQTSGVPWYLIADPDDSSINILKRSDQGEYVSVAISERVELTICGNGRFTLDLRRLLGRSRMSLKR